MKNPRLFLSYSHRDKRWVDRFAEALRSAEFDVHQSLEQPAGRDWDAWLRKAIGSSDAVVAVLSDRSEPSPYMLFEMGAADSSGKPIFPIVLGDRPPQLPLIRTRQSLSGSSPKETARRFAAGYASPQATKP